MILVSNNIQNAIELPEDTVIRINLAWVPTVEAAERILLANKDYDVFLDYPQGRSKPPTPVLTLQQALSLCAKHEQVRYFAVSNVESIANINSIKKELPAPTKKLRGVEFVPKIETLAGVQNLENMINHCQIKYIMLDKEDLYLDVGKDNAEFYKCVNLVRKVCKGLDVNLLELEGVIFISNRSRSR